MPSSLARRISIRTAVDLRDRISGAVRGLWRFNGVHVQSAGLGGVSHRRPTTSGDGFLSRRQTLCMTVLG
jgi:hypothetical protein